MSTLRFLALSLLTLLAPMLAAQQGADPSKPAPAAASLEQRVGDLEAYVNNVGPKAGDDKVAAGPIAASRAPATMPSSWSARPWCSS